MIKVSPMSNFLLIIDANPLKKCLPGRRGCNQVACGKPEQCCDRIGKFDQNAAEGKGGETKVQCQESQKG